MSDGTLLYGTCDSPVGELLLTSDGHCLTGLRFDGRPEPSWRRDDAPFEAVRRQLDEYFAGERRAFDVPRRAEGTAFQKRVWDALHDVPYGQTTTYGALARRLGDPKAVRAVGTANGANPLPILVPCHRVVGASGALTGYGGGLERKRTLLLLEAKHAPFFGF